MSIKKLRENMNLTQKEASKLLNIPLRTYINYENDPSKVGSIKYLYIEEKLVQFGLIDETHGILSIETIKDVVKDISNQYDIAYCYLFGSYARNKANASSDVDLLISTSLSGIEFFGLVETLRASLKKKVDVINTKTLSGNIELINDILKEGIKIYDKSEK